MLLLVAVPESLAMSVNEFLFRVRVDNVNLFKMLRFVEGSDLVKKLNGFLERFPVDQVEAVSGE